MGFVYVARCKSRLLSLCCIWTPGWSSASNWKDYLCGHFCWTKFTGWTHVGLFLAFILFCWPKHLFVTKSHVTVHLAIMCVPQLCSLFFQNWAFKYLGISI
jgi:hypothetical protein